MTERGQNNRPFVIGVTGRIACGKTSVLEILREKGVETIDADLIYHELIRPKLPLWETLRAAFGEGIIASDDQIDRKALGAIVFSDPELLRRLDEITHPAVINDIDRRIAASTADVIAVDGVKLVESGMDLLCDVVWRVTCEHATQKERLTRRDSISEADAERRIAAQPSPPTSTRPETEIANDADFATLQIEVEVAWKSLPVTRRRQIL
jgi:dephospho-CoA kinase